ncbi:MAG: 4Fe-4S dicluster domain-containing protein [Candidatus Omnitrophota bacterium]|nr:MAG: 4Fe-4S dicluster domain-containing protein [Candidatus Omnitrophota bacterium]
MISKKIVLRFPPKLVDKPIVYKLVKDFDLVFNILRARVTPKEEGELVIELKGNKEKYAQGMKYLKELGVKIQPLSQDVTRDEERCTHCGACITICPTGAFYMDKNTMQVIFDTAKCIACELCVKGCPPRAMKVKL